MQGERVADPGAQTPGCPTPPPWRPAARAARAARALPTIALACALALFALPSSATASEGASFGVSNWEAGTCANAECSDAGPTSEFFTQAAAHPNYGITSFRFNATKSLLGEVPVGHVKDVRVDLPSGLTVNPEAAETCSEGQIDEANCPGGSQIGIDKALGTAAGITVKEEFPVYDMQRKSGEPARFAIEAKSPTLELLGLGSIIYLEAGISWYHEPPAPGGESAGVPTGDYHEYFKIENIPTSPEIVESKLIFWGRPHEHNPQAPEKALITLPSVCGTAPVSWLHVDSHEEPGHFLSYSNETPVDVTGCSKLTFAPELGLEPETTRSDAPDGATVILTVPQHTDEPAKPNSPALRTATVSLPEGMTLNASAANGLQACTDREIGIGTDAPIGCPAKSVIGTVAVNAPGIPNGALTGSVYLGTPQSTEPASGGEYRIFLAADAPSYGVGVRLEGRVSADPQTGRLTTTFTDLPPVPFESFRLTFKGGASAPIANPLACGPAPITASLLPYSAASTTAIPGSSFTVDSNGHGGACPASPPFAPAQATAAKPSSAGASTSFTLSLTRGEGQQYLSDLATTLPEGLIGRISAVPLCGEPAAAHGSCSAASQIGTASVKVGSGPTPYELSGPVFLTGPYGHAPFGLSIAIDASKVGPFDYGTIVTRAGIEVDPYTARVSVVSALPTIIGGVPIRLRSLQVTIDRKGFLSNPTDCAQLATDSTLTSTLGATDALASPFGASGCSALPFAPKLSAKSNAKTSRRFGASLEVSLTQPAGGANVRSVSATLPRKLAVRDSTLRQACPEARFQADPYACPAGSRVGGATVKTPALPGMLTGPAYLVSHGGVAFPDLVLVLTDDGVQVVLTAHTNIKGGFTHSTFTGLPDVPIESFTLKLPIGAHSALAADGSLCRHPLHMGMRLTGQNGKQIKRRVPIQVGDCPVVILRHKIKRNRIVLFIRTPAAGRLTAFGTHLRRAHRHVGQAKVLRLAVRLSRGGLRMLRHDRRHHGSRHRHGHLKIKLHLRFVAAKPARGKSRHSRRVSKASTVLRLGR